ncbi:putative periplasmic serine endoprotease DegP-like precursor [Hartmannibacter diazotrophicus]|uniref:Probable periplasmic serine endoprotease DegP-like n=1 Tax=Hartmannibacter diazotrophicus TaxID=1482074 RepID=A0A2C9D7W5_9HYPH|nr:DegQ family serine endoprotease [Hartmannibacter diazotrophicus]SON56412.1 putative periplasmic serine endoprotease DegP-like precursor [Hartmannibacter diazotrophicus]
MARQSNGLTILVRGVFGGLVAASVLAGGLLVPVRAAYAQGPDSVADLAEGLLDAVVNISTSQKVATNRSVPMPKVPEGSPFQEFFDEFFDQQNKDNSPQRVQSLGSGFVIDSAGIIVTNNHVIEDADEIVANFNDGTKLTAELIGTDEKTDLAVLRVKPTKPLTAVKFGDSDRIRVGDWVMAIGNPFGLGGTVTVGIVSARNRDINSGPYDNFIQTDAAINRGNSGGPLFDMFGNVIGINTAIISPSGGSIGIGFSIPSSSAKRVVDQLIQYGETRRGWLGVSIQQVTDELAESLGIGTARGALVAGISDDGPAKTAGIKPGDVIVSFDGREISQMRELPRIVADTPVGEEVDVVILRQGKEEHVKVTLGLLDETEMAQADTTVDEPQADAPKPMDKVLGLALSTLDDAARQQFSIGPDVKGVVITAVDPNSEAAEKRLMPGDTIVEVAQESVSTPEDVSKAVEKLKSMDRRSALLLVTNPDGQVRFVAVKID